MIYFVDFVVDYREMIVVSIEWLVYLFDDLNDVFQIHFDEMEFRDQMDYY
jgi:hypothetical protein